MAAETNFQEVDSSLQENMESVSLNDDGRGQLEGTYFRPGLQQPSHEQQAFQQPSENKRVLGDAISITVSDPERIGDGMTNSYIVYKVTTRLLNDAPGVNVGIPTLPMIKEKITTRVRRYNDFLWLHGVLAEKFKGFLIPPLPEKNSLTLNKFSPEFIEYRRKEFQRFLLRVAKHPVLSTSPDVIVFLEASDEKLAQARTHAGVVDEDKPATSSTPAAAPAQQTGVVSSMFSFFGSAATKVSNLSSGVTASFGGSAEEVDPWFETKLSYINTLEFQLNTLSRSANALGKKHRELVDVLADFALSSNLVGHCEVECDKRLAASFDRLAELSNQSSILYKEFAEQQTEQFEESIKDYIRLVGAVKEMMKTRTDSLAAAQAITKQLIDKRDKLKSASGNAARKLQSEIADLEKVETEKRAIFEQISKNCRSELERFDAQKSREIRGALQQLVQINMNMELRVVDGWKKFLEFVQTDA